MRSTIAILAGLAGTTLAYPAASDASLDRRTGIFGLGSEILKHTSVDVGTILKDVLGGGSSASVSTSASIFVGLSARGAAAFNGGALGCSAGTISIQDRLVLKSWLNTQTHITGDLKVHLLGWCEGSGSLTLEADVLAALKVYIPACASIAAKESLYVTIDGIFGASALAGDLVLSASAQTSLAAWLEASVGLDVHVKAGLSACAAGSVIGSLSADVKVSLLAWLNGGHCTLSSSLRVSVLAWLEGRAGLDLVAVGTLGESALTGVSVGASVDVSIGETGILTASGQAAIVAFLDIDVSADIDVNVRTGLQACGSGALASSLDIDVRTSLAVWLSGSSCTLGVELKAVVLLWLSVSASADVSVGLVSGLGTQVHGWLTEEIIAELSINVRGALGLLIGGESLTISSWTSRCELAAFLGGYSGVEIDVSVQLIIFEWFTGCSIPGAPSPSASASVTGSLPSATGSISLPSGSSPTGSGSGSVPSGSSPTGSFPSGSGSVPSGSSPTGSFPSGSGSVPSGSSPTGSGSGSGSGSFPSGSGSGSYPSGSGSVPSGSSPTGSGSGSGSVPSGSSPTGSGSGSGSGSFPSGSGSGSYPSGSGSVPSGSSPTGSGSGSGSGSYPSGSGSVPSASASATIPSGSSPTGAPGSGSGSGGETATSYNTAYTTVTYGSGTAVSYSTAYSTGATTITYGSAPAPTSSSTVIVGSGSVTTEIIWVTTTVCGCDF